MRITFLEPYPAPPGERAIGGPRYRDEAVVDGLRRRGHSVQAFTSTLGSDEVRDDSFGFPWSFLGVGAVDRRLHPSTWINRKMVNAVVRSNPDLLLVRAVGTATAREVHRRCSVPSAVILGGVSRTTSILEHDLLLTETAAQERYFRLRVGGRRLLRLPKLPAAEFLAAIAPRMPERSLDVVLVSSFKPHKNLGALIPVFQYPLRIRVLGDGPERAEIERAAHGCRADVHFLGEVHPRHVAQVVAESRLLLHPSRSEGFPRAIAEAMSVGTPSVALRGVVGDPIRDGVNGILCKESELADTVMQLTRDLPRLQQLSTAARATFDMEFSPDRLELSIEELEDRMCELVQRSRIATRIDRGVRQARRSYWAAESMLRRQLRAGRG